MLEPQLGMSVDDVVYWARYAERTGYGFIFRSDHLLSTPGWGSRDSPECWVTLGAIAAATNSIAFGPMVSPIGFRSPTLLAKMACTLHSYSSGRLRLGVGAGWYRDEYEAHGWEFPRFGVRLEQFEESLKIIRPLTLGKRVKFDGRYFSANTECLPRPKGKAHLIIGGKNQRVLNLVSEYADEWNVVHSPPKEVRALRSQVDSNSAGRKITVSRMGSFIIADDRRKLETRLRRHMKAWRVPGSVESSIPKIKKRGTLYGKVDEVVAQVNQLRESGVENFYFNILDGNDRQMVDTLTHTLKEEF